MYNFRKSKKGFTLIELMVVVAIIAVLALLGLRVYSTQQNKAKEAIVKANAGTVQVQIQTALVDTSLSDVATALEIEDLNALQNPFTNLSGVANTVQADTSSTTILANGEGFVGVHLSDKIFVISGYGKDGKIIPYYTLTAQR